MIKRINWIIDNLVFLSVRIRRRKIDIFAELELEKIRELELELGLPKIAWTRTWNQIKIDGRGGVLEDTFWIPWPRSLKSSKIALSSARGQHYFWTVEISLENARDLAENLQTFFSFLK